MRRMVLCFFLLENGDVKCKLLMEKASATTAKVFVKGGVCR